MSQSLRALWLEQWIDEWINGPIFVQDKICAGDEEQLFHFVMCSMSARSVSMYVFIDFLQWNHCSLGETKL